MKAILDGCLEKMEANPGELQSITVHREVHKEKVAVEMNRSSEGPASSNRAPVTDEEMDPGRWRVPAEYGRYLSTVDPPCRSCTAQRTRSSGTKTIAAQGACSVNEG
jgi:hypothetical protein